MLKRKPLAGHAWWLLGISGIFSISVGLSNTFVNVYLWKVDHRYTSIGWYNFAIYCMIPLTFLVAGWLAKRWHSVATLRMGIVLHGLFYLIALLGGTAAGRLPVLLGVMMGLAAGFYWCSFNALSLQFTALGTRDWFYSLNGVMGAIAGVVAPPVAGWLISAEDRWGGLSGYHWIFTLSLILFGCAALCTLKLHANARRGQLKMWSALQSLARRPWRMILFGCLIYGLREGVFLFLIGLLMYIATGSELKLGEFFLLQGVLSFASFFIVGRLVKPPTRLRYLGAGAICMAATALLFLLPISARLLMVYGAVISLVLPMFLVPLQGFVFDTISQLPDATTYRMEYIILREIFENIGRVTGIGVFIGLMTMSPTALAISRFAAALGFVQLFTWMLIAVGQRRVGRTPSGPAGKPLLQRATARVGR